MNDILSNKEKWGGVKRLENNFREFRNFIRSKQLIDIGFEGKPWTWCDNQEKNGEVKERLDRFLSSKDWRAYVFRCLKVKKKEE